MSNQALTKTMINKIIEEVENKAKTNHKSNIDMYELYSPKGELMIRTNLEKSIKAVLKNMTLKGVSLHDYRLSKNDKPVSMCLMVL